jgi:hypothetical protein
VIDLALGRLVQQPVKHYASNLSFSLSTSSGPAVAMASSGEVQESLHAVAQGLRWTYALLWQLCPDQGYCEINANF